jgi:hypothetical protein
LSPSACADPGAGADADPEACDTAAADRLLPLAVGASWTYEVTFGGSTATKVSTVEALEDVGDRKAGVTAYRVRTETLDGVTVSWQEDACTSVQRHREQQTDAGGALTRDTTFEPARPRVDETPARLVDGATWLSAYTAIDDDPDGETTSDTDTESWTVVSVDEDVTVPAGTFSTIHFQRVGLDEDDQAPKDYWFAPGVGKVRETGDQTEELVDHVP